MTLDEFALAVTGDVAPSRRLFPESNDVADVLRNADAALGNLEAPVIESCGPPTGIDTGTYLRTPPSSIDDLVDFGFDGFAAATNHSGDFLREGMERTMEALERRDVAYAGLGSSLDAARSPEYVDTPAGRVGLVAATNEFDPGTQAGPSVPWATARSGVSPLRTSPVYRVPHDRLDQLEAISDDVGIEAIKSSLGIEDDEGHHLLLDVGSSEGIRFVATDDEPGVMWKLSREDTEAVVSRVEEAARRSDVTVASLHVHAGADGRMNDRTVPEFLEVIAHKCVDAGADVVFCHGPHVLRGIEIVDGVPIFYSLGDFALQLETIEEYPAEMYSIHGTSPRSSPAALVETVNDDPNFPHPNLSEHVRNRGVLPVCTFGEEHRIELHPLDLGVDEPLHRRGTPEIADGELARSILDDLQELSSAYGTTIERRENTGVVRTT